MKIKFAWVENKWQRWKPSKEIYSSFHQPENQDTNRYVVWLKERFKFKDWQKMEV